MQKLTKKYRCLYYVMPIAFRSKCRQNHALEINTKVMVAKNIQPEVFGNDVIRGGGRVKGRDRGELTKGNKKLSQRTTIRR